MHGKSVTDFRKEVTSLRNPSRAKHMFSTTFACRRLTKALHMPYIKLGIGPFQRSMQFIESWDAAPHHDRKRHPNCRSRPKSHQ